MFCTALPIITTHSTIGLLTDVFLTVKWKLRKFLLHRVDTPPRPLKKVLDILDVATFSKSVHSVSAGILRFAVSYVWGSSAVCTVVLVC